MLFEKGSRLLFTGDSITDCGRGYPVGEAAYGLGDGYVKLVSGMLTAYMPEQRIHVMNTGISGNTIRDLYQRWERDVISLKPDWVSIMIGINDVWRHFDHAFVPDDWVDQKEYADTYRKILEMTRPHVKGLLLIPPYFIDQDPQNAMTRMTREYIGEVKALAAEYDGIVCDVQKEFDELQEKMHHMMFSCDRVHPNGGHMPGHFIIARAFLKAAGCWPPA